MIIPQIHHHTKYCRLYPGIVGRASAGSARDDVAQQRARGLGTLKAVWICFSFQYQFSVLGPEMGISEDILPILMQLLQQMGPMNVAAAVPPNSATPMDEAMLRQEKMRHLQQAAAGSWSVQPALMQQLVTQLTQMQFAQQQQQQGQQSVATAAASMKKTSSGVVSTQLHTSPTKASAADTTTRQPNEFYSTVVARRPSMSGCESGGGGTLKSSNSSVRNLTAATTKLERKARPTATVENGTVTVLPLRDDTKTPCGELELNFGLVIDNRDKVIGSLMVFVQYN
ncbi:hypothetical protein NECAME_05207 [Necator americanus]|uniref:Uncharacterized protein n=1 Tax=Necator americanus TaxID=51031 RepID=W2SJ49_NECAM|nr:hypothetical protein NECAME_05207 [Necator americanus]ETN69625.1 hypothetical protein NECAME_05207 [Necator americanus]